MCTLSFLERGGRHADVHRSLQNIKRSTVEVKHREKAASFTLVNEREAASHGPPPEPEGNQVQTMEKGHSPPPPTSRVKTTHRVVLSDYLETTLTHPGDYPNT